jgi:predicted PurR-regulated permease PerM
MLRDGERLREPALELIPLERAKAEDVLSKMSQTIHAVFIGVVLVALIQGTISGVAYVVCGVPSPLVWFVATTVLCAIPLLGAPLIYVPMALLLLSQGKTPQAIGLLVVGFGVVSQVDNLLRPFVIGARVNLHPMAIFFSLLGGVLALGPVGIMAGPVLLTILLALQDIIREKNRDAEPAVEAVA